jgi:D-alanyl-D-alanine carboxypeptidase
MARQTRKAVEQRTQQRPVPSEAEGLAARREAVQRGVETRRRNRQQRQPETAANKPELKQHETKLAAEATKTLEAESTADTQEPKAVVADTREGRAAQAMATVALRGEQAQHFRALAATQGLSLSKLLVRMMEVFEAQGK